MRSPTRRNTVTEVGESPPRGFHSWLQAKGLTVVNNPNPSTPALHGLVNALANKATVPNQPVPSSNTLSNLPKEKTVVKKVAKQVDLTKDDDEPVSAEKKKVEVGDAGIEADGLVALLPYFDAKMKPFEGYIPLSIFNTQWLRLALVRQSQKMTKKKDSEDDRYNGLPMPDEWKMEFGEWISAFDLFLSYIRYYGHGDLADRFVTHRENVLAIKRERVSWIMAFRYDQAIRCSVMTFKNTDGKIANPAIRDETKEREARNETERLGDFQPRFQDINPYADGQLKANINPITGDYNPFGAQKHYTVANASGNHATHYGKPNARSWSHSNQQPSFEGSGGASYGSSYQNWDDRRSDGCQVRGRGRGGGYTRDVDRYGGGRDGDRFPNRRGEGSGSWRQDERRDDRRGEVNGPKYGGGGKAK